MKINSVFLEKHVGFSTDEGDFRVDQWGNINRWVDDEETGQGHWKNSGMKTVLLNKNDFEYLQPWKLVSMLNAAYAQGQKDCKEDFRRFIGME